MVVTSLWPEQLMVADAKNEGPKLLKAYLQFSREVSQGEFKPRVITDVESLSAKSIHALVPGVLESKRWPFLQLYSRNYWQDKDRFFNEIGKFALNNLKE